MNDTAESGIHRASKTVEDVDETFQPAPQETVVSLVQLRAGTPTGRGTSSWEAAGLRCGDSVDYGDCKYLVVVTFVEL